MQNKPHLAGIGVRITLQVDVIRLYVRTRVCACVCCICARVCVYGYESRGKRPPLGVVPSLAFLFEITIIYDGCGYGNANHSVHYPNLLHVGPKDGTQAVRMDSGHFYSLRHPAAHHL